jgi:hypothetical protein
MSVAAKCLASSHHRPEPNGVEERMPVVENQNVHCASECGLKKPYHPPKFRILALFKDIIGPPRSGC